MLRTIIARCRLVACLALVLACHGGILAGESADGVYRIGYEGEGPRVERYDEGTGTLLLGPKLTAELERASVRSIANDNQLFRVEVSAPAAEVDQPGPPHLRHLALCVAGCWMPIASQGEDPESDGLARLAGRVRGLENARRVAAALGVKPELREHPGHRFTTRFTPSRRSYAPGGTITLTLEIQNTGRRPFSFMDGGMQRGPRNNQFMFLAYRAYGYGRAVPDTGDPTNFGGPAGIVTLEPGETFTKEVKLDDWFELSEPDTYRVTGVFRMEITDPDGWRPKWDDFAIGECLVRIEAPQEAEAEP